jgi:hypothetical protein
MSKAEQEPNVPAAPMIVIFNVFFLQFLVVKNKHDYSNPRINNDTSLNALQYKVFYAIIKFLYGSEYEML